MRRWWRRPGTALLVVAVILVSGCGGDDAATTQPAQRLIRVAMFSAGSTLPVHVAVQEKIFEHHGLTVELTEGQDLPLFMAALAKGQYDIAMTGPSLMLIAAEKRLDLEIVSSMQRSSREEPNAVWITRDPSIDDIAELRGKTIGVPALTGIIADTLTYLLDRNGVARDEVMLLQTPFPTMGDQLQAGHVDAVVASIPFGDAIAARGFRVHDDVIVEAVRDASGGRVQSAMTSVWASSRSFATQQPEAIRAWRSSLEEAIAYLRRDEPRARAVMRDWLKFPAQVLERAPLPDWVVDIAPDDLAPYVTISNTVGATSTQPDLDALVWRPR
jgi:NitT/TauT family transport system substrate-binding protein